MKKLLPLLIILLSIPTTKAQSICFTENKGQVYDQNYKARPDVLFGVMAGNMAVHIKNTGVSYQLYRVDKWKEATKAPFSLGEGRGGEAKFPHKEIEQQTIYRIDLTWVNANPNFTKTTDEALPGYNNYYLESCPNGALNVKSYKGVTLHNLYKGINLHYYEKQGQLKHDYILAPHANYKNIQLKVEGAQVSINKDGSLLLNTPLGKVQEGAPVVYQNGKQLKAKWVITGTEPSRSVSFVIDNYNPNYELIIDPVTRLWGTYYGGAGDSWGMACSTDASGNIYMSGFSTLSTGATIATSGSHQSAFGGSLSDAFLVKFDANGVRQWGTYYGGAGWEESYSCCTDLSGNVYLAGVTTSSAVNVIATSGNHQPNFGGASDAFLVKFDANGARQWGTYYGDYDLESFGFCCTDVSGNVYLSGDTEYSTGTVIATPGSHQPTIGGNNDAFLVKFDANGVRQWGTYYGDLESDRPSSCSTDASGNVYMSGLTRLSGGTVIATSGSHQPTIGGIAEAFLVKFDGNGVRQWGTYYGGYAASCSTDIIGNVYMSGTTDLNNSIATPGSHQSTFGGGMNDAFLVKFDSNGVRQWGTYYGGLGVDESTSCNTDVLGNVYVSGHTWSTTGNNIAALGGYQSTFAGGGMLFGDAFLVKFDADGLRQWGTYYGGSDSDAGQSCSADPSGNVYMSGFTDSDTGTVIATSGSHQPFFGSGLYGRSAFLVKFENCLTLTPTAAVSNTLCSGATLNFTASITSTAIPTYAWAGPNGFTSSAQNPSITEAGLLNMGIYTLTVNNDGCVETTTTEVTAIYATNPTASLISPACLGANLNFAGNIAGSNTATYSWAGPNSFTSSTQNPSIIGANILNVGTYTLVVNNNGCTGTATTQVTSINANPTITVNSGAICLGNSFTITPSGAVTYTYSDGSAVVNPISNSVYSVTGTNSLGCVGLAISNVSLNTTPTITVNSGAICIGNTFTIAPTGASTYTIQGGNNVVNPTTNSSYTVLGISTQGCLSNMATSTVNVNKLPIMVSGTSNSIICGPLFQDSATLTASGATSYTWSNGSNASSIVVSPSLTTTYSITGTDANGCSNTAFITQSVSACTGLNKITATSNLLCIYPNPANDLLNIITSVNADELVSIQIINNLGQALYQSEIHGNESTIPLNQLANGIYYVQLINTSHQTNTQKFIIQR